MKEPHYRQALSFGWHITWRHPFLWLYGLFAAILGQMGLLDFLAHVYRATAEASSRGELFTFSLRSNLHQARLMFHFLSLPPDGWVWALWLAVFMLGLVGLVLFASVISQGALIHAAAQGIGKNQSVAADSREWHAGVNHFWRLLAVSISKKIILAGLTAIVVWSAYAAAISLGSGDIILFLITFLIASIIGVILSFLAIYAAGYIVVEELPFFRSVGLAWKLFLAHWLVSFEIGFGFLLLNVVLDIFALFGFVLLLLPVALLWLLSVAAANSLLFGLTVALLLILFAMLVMFVGATFTVFSTSAWTYLFMKMHRYGIRSRILHWLRIGS